jgi:membrane protein
MNKESIIDILKETYHAWSKDRATRLAAALSFYTVFSIAPLTLILISVVGSILDKQSVQDMVLSQLQANIGNQGVLFIANALKNDPFTGHNFFVTLITFLSLILAAVGIFGHLKASFNTIWHVEDSSDGIIGAIKNNLISFGLVILLGTLFVVSLLISTTISIVSTFFSDVLPYSKFVIELLNQSISFGIITVLFGTVFKVLPDTTVEWTDVWEGGLFTAILFTIGRFLFGIYISHTAIATQYGAAGSLIIILLWVYYSAQILFFGAEMTKIYSYQLGSQKLKQPKRKKR